MTQTILNMLNTVKYSRVNEQNCFGPENYNENFNRKTHIIGLVVNVVKVICNMKV